MPIENNEISVSVLCVTYNHESYISRAMDSFLAQEVDFTYEIIIADDGSKNETKELINNINKEFEMNVIHSWQQDYGFRAARSRNNATRPPHRSPDPPISNG